MPKKSAAQVTVDEAVIKKGGKPGSDFVQSLNAATGATEAAEKAREAEEHYERRVVFVERATIPLKQLRPYLGNPRETLGDVNGLKETMETMGFLGALLVREISVEKSPSTMDGLAAVYEVITGNRRLEAAKQAGLEEVPCDVYELTDVQALEMNLTEQINRKELTPLEEGEACRRLIELASYTREQVAAKLGQSPTWVTKRLSLCGLAAETKKALAKGTLSLTVAMGIAALPTQKLQADATKTALNWAEGGYGADETLEKLREEVARPLAGVPFKLTDADLVPEAGACSKCPYNSTNAKMPGLFDNAKAGATCAKVVCLDEKLMAAWKRDAKELTERGAKLLSLSESARIFRGGVTLDSASKYVVVDAPAPQDRTKRTWHELLRKAGAGNGSVAYPQRYAARDGKGSARELVIADAAKRIIAEKLKLKWAQEEEGEELTPNDGPLNAEEAKQRAEIVRARSVVREQAEVKIAKAIGAGGLKLTHLRAMLSEDDVERFAEAMGFDKKARAAFDKSANFNQLAAAMWLTGVSWDWMPDGFDERLVTLCKSEGIDLDAMLKAQLDGAKAEALFAKKAG